MPQKPRERDKGWRPRRHHAKDKGLYGAHRERASRLRAGFRRLTEGKTDYGLSLKQ